MAAGWNDPIAGALQSTLNTPMPGAYAPTASDAVAAQQQSWQPPQDAGSMGAMGGQLAVSRVTPGAAVASSATPYGFNPSTGKLLVNGREVPHDIALWQTAANMPADQLQPMDVHAIGSDGYLPMTQAQLQDFLMKITPESSHLSSALHNAWEGTQETVGGGLRAAAKVLLPSPGDTSPLAMYMRTAVPATQLTSTIVDSLGQHLGATGSVAQSVNAAASGIEEGIRGDNARSDAERRAGMTLAQQAGEDVTFGAHPGMYTANLFSHGLARSAPGLAAFAVNPGLGAAALGAQGSSQMLGTAGERFDVMTQNLSPEQMAQANPLYAQLRATGHSDTDARAFLRSQATEAAGDIGGAAMAATGLVGGRIPMALLGRSAAMLPAMGGAGAGGFLLRRLGMTAGTAAENAALNVAGGIPGQVAADVVSGQGAQSPMSYVSPDGTFDALLTGAAMGLFTRGRVRPQDPIAVAQGSDIAAASATLDGAKPPVLPLHRGMGPEPGNIPPLQGGMSDMFGGPGRMPAQPEAPAAPAAPRPGIDPGQPDLLQGQPAGDLVGQVPQPQAPAYRGNELPNGPAPLDMAPAPNPAQPDMLPAYGPQPAPTRGALIRQRAAERANPPVPSDTPVAALPPPGPTEGMVGQVDRARQSLQLVQDMLDSGNFNKRTKSGKATIARLEQERDMLAAEVAAADQRVLGEQIGQARAERPPVQGASFVGDPASGQMEIPMPHEPAGDPRLTGSAMPPGAGPRDSVEPPPLPNPIPMSAAEAQSRLRTQMERDDTNPQGDMLGGPAGELRNQLAQAQRREAPPALDQAVATSEQGVSPSTPEPAGDLAAQVARLGKGADAVFVAAGNEAQMPKVKRGVRKVVRPEGTLLTTNPDKAKAYRDAPRVDDALLAQLQDLPETKADALRKGRAAVVAAEDASGNVVKEAVSTPGGPNDAVVAAATPAGGKTVRRTALEAQARRAAKVAAEPAPAAPTRSRLDVIKDAAAKKRAAPKKKVDAPVTTEELQSRRKTPDKAGAKAATDTLLEDVRQNHPNLDVAAPVEHAGPGRTTESPLLSIPLTEREMGTLAERVVATAAHEHGMIEAGGAGWSAKHSALRRILDMMNLPVASEHQLRAVVRDMARMPPETLRHLLTRMAPRLADSTLAKGIVRGMDHVLAAVSERDNDTHGRTGVRELDDVSGSADGARVAIGTRFMDLGSAKAGEKTEAPEPTAGARSRAVVYGKDVPGNVSDVVGHWVKTIEHSSGQVFPDQLHVMTPAEAVARYGAQLAGHDGKQGFTGRVKGPDGKMETVVAVDWKGLGDGPAAVEALAHEVGHITADRIFDLLPNEDQAAVRSAFNDWLQTADRGTPSEAMISRLPPALGDLLRQSGAKPERAYAQEWHEWVADETAKWLVTSQKPRNGVERFLSKVATAMKSLYANITGRGRPTEAVQQMMDNWVANGKALKSADAAARAAQMGYGREAAEPVRPAEASRAKINTKAVAARMDAAVHGAMDLGKDVTSALQGNPAGVTRQLHNAIAAVAHGKAGDFIRRVSFEVSNMSDMVGRYGGKAHGAFGEGLTRWDHVMRLAEKYSKDAQQQGQLAIERAQRLSTPVRNVLEDLMYKSTVYGVHPDEAFGVGRNKHLLDEDSGTEDANRRRYGEVQQLWRQLDGVQGSPRKVYADLRAAMAKLHEDIFEARREHVDGLDIASEAKEDAHRMLNAAEERMLEGPYFPLVREGSYITTARAPYTPLGEFQSKGAAEAAGRRAKAANPHAEISIAENGDGTFSAHASERAVYFHDTLKDALAAKPEIEAEMREAWKHASAENAFNDEMQGGGASPVISEPMTTVDFYRKAEVPNQGTFITAINKLRDRQQLDPQAYQMLAEMYIESLPEASPRKAYLRRENIRGANRRMLAGYGRRLLGAAHSYGQTKISGERNASWAQMMKHRGDKPEYGKVLSDIYRRQDILAKRMVHNPMNTFASTVQDASSFMSLAFSPAFLMQQILQPLVLSAPVLAARAGKDGKAVGYGRTMDALKEAYAGAPKFFGSRGLQQFQTEFKRLMGTYGGDGLTLQQSADALISKFGKGEDEQAMLHYMHDRGTLDFSFLNATNDATTLSATGSKAKSIMRLSMAFAQQVEAMNRTVTGLAAYRLAREARGMEHADAVREANAVVSQTHGDYSRYNRPSAFNRPLLGMALQFKMYTQFMYSILVSNVAHAMNPKLSKVERAQALRTLGYVIGSHGVIGGAVGLGPVAAAGKVVLGGLLAGMAQAGLVDDKKKDQTWTDYMNAEVEDYGDEVFGAGNGHALRKAGTYGLLGLLGTSMANKISIPDLTDTRFTGTTPSESDTPGASIDRYALSALGSVYSNVKRAANGTALLAHGDLTGAAKQILPAAPRALLNAATEAQDGIVTAGGKELKAHGDITPYDTFLRALGTNSADTDLMYSDRSRRQAVIDRSSARRAEFIAAYRKAAPEDRGAILQQVAEYNQGRPKALQISSATMKRALEPQSRGRSKLETAAGKAIDAP